MISGFDILDEQNLCISSTTFLKLTIQRYCKPENYRKIELSTPSICFFGFISTLFLITWCLYQCLYCFMWDPSDLFLLVILKDLIWIHQQF